MLQETVTGARSLTGTRYVVLAVLGDSGQVELSRVNQICRIALFIVVNHHWSPWISGAQHCCLGHRR